MCLYPDFLNLYGNCEYKWSKIKLSICENSIFWREKQNIKIIWMRNVLLILKVLRSLIIPIKAKKIFIVSFEQQTLKKTNFSYFQKEFYLKTILYWNIPDALSKITLRWQIYLIASNIWHLKEIFLVILHCWFYWIITNLTLI